MKPSPRIQLIFGGRHHTSRAHCAERRWDGGFKTETRRIAKANDSDVDPLLSSAVKAAAEHNELISINPKIMQGRPCMTGTRIPVTAVLRVIEQYGSLDDVVRCYPHLTKEHAVQALIFSQSVLEPPSGADEFTYSA